MEGKKFFGYKASVGAFLVIFVNIGVCTTLGVFIAQLASYSGWSLSACVIIGTINTIVNMLLSLVAIDTVDIAVSAPRCAGWYGGR